VANSSRPLGFTNFQPCFDEWDSSAFHSLSGQNNVNNPGNFYGKILSQRVIDVSIEKVHSATHLSPDSSTRNEYLPFTFVTSALSQHYSRDVIGVVMGFFNSTAADMEWKLFIVNFTRIMEIIGYSISFISIALSIFILSHFR
jgi:hypothetical protein